MSTPPGASWRSANQRYLSAALGVVRAALQRHTGQADGPEGSPDQALAQAAQALPAPAALDSLCAAFELSPFERDLLLLCAGVELSADFAALCAAAQGDQRRPYATFSLALAALPEAHWSALAPAAPLRYWRMIEVTPGASLVASPLRIDECVLHYLAGLPHLDDRLQGLIAPLAAAGELPPSQQATADQIARIWSQPREAIAWPIVQLCGHNRVDTSAVAASACAGLGLRLHTIAAAAIPAAPAEREALARLWERQALLSGSALLIDCDEHDPLDGARAMLAFAEHTRGMLLVAGREPLALCRRSTVRLDIGPPSPAEQRQLWRVALGPAAAQMNGQIDELVAQFNLGPQAIGSAALEHPVSAPAEALWDACRAAARVGMDALAQRIEPAASWEDLVLPPAQHQILRDIAVHVRQRMQVYEHWGFAAKGGRGLGISALFAGPSGTGKTMAAEVLAHELRLDLYKIDLSQVVSKYIGETEKNLRRVFDAAEQGAAILLFDEADALFGKRSEVRDSHDRYANVEVSYLLQRMESYRGLAILTTNMKQALDPAFLRRIRFVAQFPFPDAAQRAEIWRRIFPAATPTEGLDAAKLARLNMAGGNIRNIALQAAFLASDERAPVRMAHLLRAARAECAKLEKPLSEAEIGGWA